MKAAPACGSRCSVQPPNSHHVIAATWTPCCAQPRSFSGASRAESFLRFTTSIHQASRRGAPLQGYVDASVTVAVTQQTVAYAVLLAAEAAYTRQQPTESDAPADADKGKPEVLPVGVAVGTTLLVLPFVNSGNPTLTTVGFIVGLLTSGIMLVYNAKRVADTPQDGSTWPGPKAWPASMTLVSFLALCLYIQSLYVEI